MLENNTFRMNLKKIIVTTSWDDGNPLDIKLCSILKNHNIKGTIYTPIQNKDNKLLSEEEIKKISEDFEIGGHYTYDISLTEISNNQLEDQLNYSKEELERITGKEIVSFCYPNGKYNKDVIKKVKQAGFKSGRTAELLRTTISNPFHFHTTVQAEDRIFLSKVKQAFTTNNYILAGKLVLETSLFKRWDVIAKRTFDYVLNNGGIWHLWGHSLDLQQNNDWNLLNDTLEYVYKEGKKNNAEFLTNGEVIQMLQI